MTLKNLYWLAAILIVGAMTALGYGQEEIDEVVCILVSLKDQVVFE